MIANLMNVAGVDHVITIDLHATQSQGFFKCPVDNLRAEPLLAKWIRNNVKDWTEAVVVSKNPGGTKRVTSLADALKLSFGIVTTDQRRPNINNSMANSAIFGSMGLDGTAERALYREEEAEAHIYPEEPSNIEDVENDSVQRSDYARQAHHQESHKDIETTHRSPRKLRAPAVLAHNALSRLGNTHNLPSPLAQSSRPDSNPGSDIASDAESEHKSTAPALRRMTTALGTVNSSQTLETESDSEPEGDEFNDEVSGPCRQQKCAYML